MRLFKKGLMDSKWCEALSIRVFGSIGWLLGAHPFGSLSILIYICSSGWWPKKEAGCGFALNIKA